MPRVCEDLTRVCVLRSLEASMMGNGQLGGWGRWKRPMELEEHLGYLAKGRSGGARLRVQDKVFHPVKRMSALLRGFLELG